MENKQQIIILGQEYTIDYIEGISKCGYCDWTSKVITINKNKKSHDTYDDLDKFELSVLRHEIIHAFLDESGLMCSSDWARNEEMVDWIANQFPKLQKCINQAEKEFKERLENIDR